MTKAILAALAALLLCVATAGAQAPEAPTQRLFLRGADGAHATLRVEVADEPAEWGVGLMHRESLAEDRGMLFIFDRDDRWAFWMRNTLVPLSIAFVAADGTIVDIQDMEPLDETLHVAAVPARMALEVNQGYFARHGIGVGDRLVWPAVARLPLVLRATAA